MHALDFIQDLAIVMIIAGIVTVLFHRLKQPVVLGYIVAGVIIGPYTPPFQLIHDQDTINTLAELGVIFLLFSLGLEFSLKKLARVGIPALVAAVSEIVVMMWVGYEIGMYFGWGSMNSLFLGAMLAVSSTTIIIKALEELKMKDQPFAQLIFGVLIIEDILAIAMIALLSAIATTGEIQTSTVFATLGSLSLFIVTSLIVGILLVPRILAYVAKFKSNEMLLITVLAICFGFCLLVAKLNYSMALGAFVIGAIMAEAKQHHLIEQIIEPIRHMFSAIFFVAIGLLFNPSVVVEYALPIFVITVAVVVGKLFSCGTGSFIAGQDGRTSMRVGMGLSQIGEFSFIIATLGVTLNVTSEFLYPIVVAVSAITTLLTPYLIKLADPASRKLGEIMPKRVAEMGNHYTKWLQNIHPQGNSSQIIAIVRKTAFQVLINLALVIAVFICSAYASPYIAKYLASLGISMRWSNMIVWGLALFLSSPCSMVAYGKMKALSMMLSELSVSENMTGEYTTRVRRIMSELLLLAAIAGFFVLIMALSTSILPSADHFIMVIVLVVVLCWFFRKRFLTLHARLKEALLNTLSD